LWAEGDLPGEFPPRTYFARQINALRQPARLRAETSKRRPERDALESLLKIDLHHARPSRQMGIAKSVPCRPEKPWLVK
jgi:hypothetical protein